MAKTVEEPPNGWGRGARGSKGSRYWRFLDGQTWCLQRGVDFDRRSKPVSIATAIRAVAKKRGVRVRMRLERDEVYVQAIGKVEEPDGEEGTR